jgi:hypothetical protein
MRGKLGPIVTVLLAMLGFCCTDRTGDLQDAAGISTLRDVSVSRSLCEDERTCDELWGANTGGCNAHLESCLNALTPDQQREWEAAVRDCIESTSACSDRFTCYAAAPWC